MKAKFLPKPIVVDAIQLTDYLFDELVHGYGILFDEFKEFMGNTKFCAVLTDHDTYELLVSDGDSQTIALVGNFVFFDKGFQVMTEDDFNNAYEPNVAM